jgi:hypothetical protein
LLLEALCKRDVDSIESLAGAYQHLFQDIARSLESDRVAGAPDARDRAALARWIIGNPSLFCDLDSEAWCAVRSLLQQLVQQQRALIARLPLESHTAPAMLEGSGVDEYLLIRGSSKTPGPQVARKFLEAIAGGEPPRTTDGSGRLDLARYAADPANPLTARVIVNRVWQHLFGQGLVPTVDNFGVLGEPPSHPELLDYVAHQFIADGWSIKRLIRGLVLSRTYQMSSRPEPAAAEIDPENRLLHRMRIRRLEGEAIRDAILAVSGDLDHTLFGPSIPTHLTPFMEGRGRPQSGPLDGHGRRSIYISVRRNFLSPLMLAFDMPIPFSCMGRRNVSNVPAQALILMNDPFVVREASHWASRALAHHGRTSSERVCAMYLAAFGRRPNSEETTAALGFLEEQGRGLGLPGDQWEADSRPWADLAHVLFNSKEFIFIN